MPPAIIAGAVAAVGTIGGALISSHSANSAANQANASQQAATQAQLQLGQQSLGQQRDIFNAEYNLESPFVSRGNVAGNNINALLGLPAAPTMTSPLATGAGAPGTPGAGGSYTGPSLAQIQAMQHDGIPGNYQAAMQAYNAAHQAGAAGGMAGGGAGGGAVGAQNALLPNKTPLLHDTVTNTATGTNPVPGTTPAPGTTQPSAMDAFNQFANSAGMQLQQQQAANGLNNLYAGHSQLQSGAAMKAIPAFLQQQALNNYFMPYMGLLGQQQSTGAQAGAAIGGVGSNFSNTAAATTAGMSNAIGNGADAASNAALIRGQNSSNMWNGIGSALGTLGSSFFRTGG